MAPPIELFARPHPDYSRLRCSKPAPQNPADRANADTICGRRPRSLPIWRRTPQRCRRGCLWLAQIT